MKPLVRWEKKIDAKQIADASGFLRLFLKKNKVQKAEQKLRKGPHKLVTYKAADLIRASNVPEIPGNQREVSAQLQKIIMRIPLRPVIIISTGEKLFIADGYHRISACHSIDDDIDIATVHIEV